MLVITETASAVIRSIVDRAEIADAGGIRIATASEDRSEPLTVAPAETPQAGDEVVEEQGARVFVEPNAVPMLDDKKLDARIDDKGAAQFLLTTQ